VRLCDSESLTRAVSQPCTERRWLDVARHDGDGCQLQLQPEKLLTPKVMQLAVAACVWAVVWSNYLTLRNNTPHYLGVEWTACRCIHKERCVSPFVQRAPWVYSTVSRHCESLPRGLAVASAVGASRGLERSSRNYNVRVIAHTATTSL